MRGIITKKIHNFIIPENIIPCEVLELAVEHESFPITELYEEIQDEIDNHNIDREVYTKVTSFAISETWIENNKFRFKVNNIDINEYDVKIFLLHGYIYIFHKSDFVFGKVTIVLYKNGFNVIENDNTEISNSFDENISLNIRNNLNPKYAVNIPFTFFVIRNGETNLDVMKSKFPDNYNDEILLHKCIYYMQYNPNKGFFNDNTKIDLRPLYIKNTSTDADDIVLVIYKKLDDYMKLDNLYYNELFKNKDRLDAWFKYLDEVPFNYNKYIDYEYINSQDEILTSRDFMYDMYNDIMKHTLPSEFLFTNDNIEIDGTMDNLTDVQFDPIKRGKNYRNYIKFNFHNPRNRVPEVFYKGRIYQGYKLVEKNINITTVAIKLDEFKQYYELNPNKDPEDITILLKPDTYHKYHYEDITKEYNSIVPIGRWFFSGFHKRRYVNGYIAKEEEFGFNTIPPYNLLCAFMKRQYKGYDVYDTHYVFDRYIIKKDIHLKFRNISESLDDILSSTDKFIYKNYLFTDYIDYEYQLYCGPYLLQKDVDYEILSPKCIHFLKPLYKYKEDNIDSDYINITIENLFQKDKDMYKEFANKSSYLNKVFSNKNIIKYLADKENDTIVLNTRIDNDCGKLYDKKVYDTHMYLTKYFSSEVVLDGRNGIYGDEWFNKIKMEFPQFITPEGNVLCDFEVEDNISFKDIPRVVTLPENEPLNLLIGNDIAAKNRIKYLNLDLPYDNGIDERNNELFVYKYYTRELLKTLIGESMKYLYTVPFNAIYRKDELPE